MFQAKPYVGNCVFSIVAIFISLGLTAAPSAHAVPLQVASAPESNLSLTISALSGAHKTILLNIYELTSPEIVDALKARIAAGVHLEILEEGQPVGGLSTAAKGVQSELLTAMTETDHLYEMTSKAGGKRRFRFDHAKYAVIDDMTLLIGSENYSPTGNPAPGTVGNRGWEVVVQDKDLAARFTKIFRADADPSQGDVLDLDGRRGIKGVLSPLPKLPAPDPAIEADSVNSITSPDTSLDGLVNAMNNARKTIDIEQMTFNMGWGKDGGTSPLYAAVVAAAKRGVKVRVLANDERVFDHPNHPSKPVNRVTVQALNELAESGGYALEARVANVKAMGVDYIHNKGMLIDGTQTLISSINWDENSVEHNREAAVVVMSAPINAYYGKLFDYDWTKSAAAGPIPLDEMMPLATNATDGMIPDDDEDAVDCPAALQLQVTYGQLLVGDAQDRDYRTLSGMTQTARYVRARTEGCLLVLSGADARNGRTGIHRFVELRGNAAGDGLSFLLEGFTPLTSKVYSVRAKLKGTELPDTFSALVYAGSGTRERLGTAKITILEQ